MVHENETDPSAGGMTPVIKEHCILPRKPRRGGGREAASPYERQLYGLWLVPIICAA